MLDNPGGRDGSLIAFSSQKIKTNHAATCQRTAFDAWLDRQRGRLDAVGDFARRVRLIGFGLTPAKLKHHLIHKARCDGATLRACDHALAEFRIARLGLRRRRG